MLLAAAPPPAAAEAEAATVEVELLVPVLDWTETATGLQGFVDLGRRHGLVIGGRRDIYRHIAGEGGQVVGEAELTDVGDTTTVLTGFAATGDTLGPGDHVLLRLDLPRPGHDLLMRRLVRWGLALTDLESEVLLDYHTVLGDLDDDLDDRLLDAFAAKVRALAQHLTADDFPDLFEPAESGRYTGRTVAAVMTTATADDLRGCVYFTLTFPGLYLGQSAYIEEVFANWALRGGPESSLEILARVRDLSAEGARTYLAARREQAVDELIIEEWYQEDRRLAAEGREEERLATITAMGWLCEAIDDPRFWDLYWSSKASYHQAREEWDDAVACWQASVAVAAAGTQTQAVSYHNLGGVLRLAGRFDEALTAFNTSLDHYGARQDTLGSVDAAESWRGVGRCLVAMGHLDEAAAALEASAELFARRGGLSDIEHRCGVLAELGEAYEEVGRYRQAIDAWTRELAAARELGWDATIASALCDMSDGFWSLGDLQQAVEERLQARRIYTDLEQDYSLAVANTNLGSLYWDLGETEAARQAYEAALAVHAERGDWWDLADVQQRLGTNERKKGNHHRALDLLAQALQNYAKGDWLSDTAATRLEIAETYESMGYTTKADSVYALAQADNQQAGDVSGEAGVLEWWGYSLILRKQGDAARSKLTRALELSEASGNLGDQADIWRTLASLYSGQSGEHERAIAAAETSLALARQMPSRPHEAKALSMLANVLFSAGRIDEAFTTMGQARVLFESIGDQAAIVDCYVVEGTLQASRGEYQSAMATLEQAMHVAEAADLPGPVARVLSVRAWQHYRAGRHEAAIADAERSLAIYEAQNNDWAMADLYNTMGSARSAQGLFDEAVALHRKSLAIRETWSDPYGIAASNHNLGDVYQELGDTETAVRYYETAREIGERIGYIEVLTVTAANLARCYLDLGRADEALALVEGGLAVAREVGVVPRILDLQSCQSHLFAELGRHDEAAAVLEEALVLARESVPTIGLLKLEAQLGAVDWRRGRFAAAAARLSDVVPRLRETRNPVLLWEPLFYWGRSLRDSGRPEEAATVLLEAIDTLEEMRQGLADAETAGRYQEHHGDIYRELVDVLMTLGREEEAWRIVSLMKTQEVQEMKTAGPALAAGDQALVDQAEGLRSHEANLVRLLREELNRPAEEQRAELIETWQAEIDSLKLRFHDFTRRLRTENRTAYERLEVEPVSFNQLRRGLLETEAFIEPVVLADRIVVFVVRAGDAPLIYREIPVSEDSVRTLIRLMREGLERPTVAWESTRAARLAGAPSPAQITDPSEPARRLHDLLIAPLVGDLIGVETLIVSPSGRLRYIPFAALFDGERYLLERFQVTVLTQAGTLTSRRPILPEASLLAFGNPDSSLAGAEVEVGELATIWSPAPVTAVYGAEATKARLRAEIADFSILHLATHGCLLNDRPEASYLVLAGDGDAGRLTFRDIVLLPLDTVDLAVLSACETAMGENGEGKEIAGLAYNFEQTGAAAVIASLWMVSDESTAALMTEMYRILHEGQATRAEALQRAQLSLRHSADHAHPYYWAPFILIGNWR